MSRIRTIKPEFFTSADVVGCSPLARLLFIALWCEADRSGRMEWKPKTLKLRYLPADDCSIEALAAELEAAGMLRIYEADGRSLAEVPNFGKHQVINNREAQSALPARVVDASGTRAPRVKAEGKEGRKGKEDARDDPVALQDGPAPPPVASIPLVDGTEFEVSSIKAAEWCAAFPAVDVGQRLLAIRAWCIANPTRRKTRRGAEAFIVQWLGKDQDSGRGGTKAPKTPQAVIPGLDV